MVPGIQNDVQRISLALVTAVDFGVYLASAIPYRRVSFDGDVSSRLKFNAAAGRIQIQPLADKSSHLDGSHPILMVYCCHDRPSTKVAEGVCSCTRLETLSLFV